LAAALRSATTAGNVHIDTAQLLRELREELN
jgi:hypothetical protein